MLQIAILVMGVLALVKGELKVSRSRVLAANKARMVGVALLVVAVFPMFLGDVAGLVAMVVGGVAVTVVAFMMATKNELADQIPMN